MARARKFAAVAGTVLVLALLVSSCVARGVRDDGARPARVRLLRHRQQEVAYEILRTTAGGGSDQLTLEKYVLRGDVATFVVINRSSKPHGFVFYGHTIRPLKPGARTRFSALADPTRLVSRIASTPAGGKRFKGVFPVY